MSAKNKWLIGAGIVLGLIVLFFLPSIWQVLFPSQGFGMMGYAYNGNGYGHRPMMGGYGFSPLYGLMGFGMFFMWLIPLGLLALIVLGIAALVKYLKSHSS